MKHWPQPKNLKQLRGFLGLTGYYRRFVAHYATIAAPLTELLKKDNFLWGKKVTAAFERLKRTMMETSVLVLPDFAKTFMVETNRRLGRRSWGGANARQASCGVLQ